MCGLVQANFAATGKSDLCNRSPPFFVDRRANDAFSRQTSHLGRKVFAHEIQFMAIVVFGRMKSRFCRGQSEDQPAVTGIDGRQPKHLAKKDAVRLRILAVDDDMCTRNHGVASLTPPAEPVDAVM